MAANLTPPDIDRRRLSDLVAQLKAMAPHYTPDWTASDPQDFGTALLSIFSFLAEGVIDRLNQAPHKNFVAFLDMLGIQLLPATPARVPLQFLLAQGTEDEIRIPVGVRATAQTEQGDLPFETEKELLAIPSALLQAVAVDPDADAIYKPPPGFLELETEATAKPPYTILSFSAKDGNSVQLDRVDDLKEKDQLRIRLAEGAAAPAPGRCGCGPEAEAVSTAPAVVTEDLVIASLEGEIVIFEDNLEHDYPAQTEVEKVTDFRLFEGKNLQEHVLYLGHPDFFNVKSAADFQIEIRHLPGTEVGLQRLDIVWEYWGEAPPTITDIDAQGNPVSRWRPFQATSDGSDGLSRNGVLQLSKPEGEIKERQVNGIQNRWIRGRLLTPVPSSSPRQLPQLDLVSFRVSSSGEGLPADQAFSNVTPLDLPYRPFGAEPRLFDSFYLASQEIFSKKRAQVNVQVELDLADTLAEPAAVSFQNRLQVFARGPGGGLAFLTIDPTNNNAFSFENQDPPEGADIAITGLPGGEGGESGLSAVTDGVRLFVFVRTEDGRLYHRFYNGAQWFWIDLGKPSATAEAVFSPSAVALPDGTPRVFVTGSDGSLYSNLINRANGAGSGWNRLPAAPVNLSSSPFATLTTGTDPQSLQVSRLRVFAIGQDRVTFAYDEAANSWSVPGPAGSRPRAGENGRPWGQILYDANANLFLSRIWIRDGDGRLREYDDVSASWTDLGTPAADVQVASNPAGAIDAGGDRHVFVRGSNNRLWERGANSWIPLDRPGESSLNLSPFLLLHQIDFGAGPQDFLSVFSASSRNSELELRRDLDADEDLWLEFKDPDDVKLRPTLSWEYWNGKGWVVLRNVQDSTGNLLNNGTITFALPQDIEKTDVSGQDNFWVRARIIAGDYGRETFELIAALTAAQQAQRLVSKKNTIRPPLVNQLTLSYQLTAPEPPQRCLTYNNLDFIDQTNACRTPGRQFQPFIPLEAKQRAFYLGFDKAFSGGPVQVFFASQELRKADRHKMEWAFRTQNTWRRLSSEDDSEGLTRAGILSLNVPDGFQVLSLFGSDLYWIRGLLVEGQFTETPVLKGIFPNSAAAFQAETVGNEIVGSSDGQTPFQTFRLQRFPFLQGEVIRVREVLTDQERRQLRETGGKDALEEVRDEKGELLETWVRWTEVADFFASGPESRHCETDRANGLLRFGDGLQGRIPPAGADNIRAFFYQAGGGLKGNVPAGQIQTLATAVAGVDSVRNPVAADGGSDTATLEQMLDIGPGRISHRDRAVSREDWERLAREASRKVVKARCLPNTNPLLQRDAGWVSVFIVPESAEAEPIPSLQLRQTVRRHLEARSDLNLSAAKQIFVAPPEYVKINVSVDLYAVSIEAVAQAENEARSRLSQFLHPLRGGPDGSGWEFGRQVSVSDLYALLEGIPGVDHAENLRLDFDGQSRLDFAEVAPHALVASGQHTVRMQVAQSNPGGECLAAATA